MLSWRSVGRRIAKAREPGEDCVGKDSECDLVIVSAAFLRKRDALPKREEVLRKRESERTRRGVLLHGLLKTLVAILSVHILSRYGQAGGRLLKVSQMVPIRLAAYRPTRRAALRF